MDMFWIEIIGYLAGVLIVISLLPQVVLSWRTKKTHDISLWRFILYVVGLILLVVYGYLIASWPIVVMNVVAVVLAGIILYLKLRYK